MQPQHFTSTCYLWRQFFFFILNVFLQVLAFMCMSGVCGFGEIGPSWFCSLERGRWIWDETFDLVSITTNMSLISLNYFSATPDRLSFRASLRRYCIFLKSTATQVRLPGQTPRSDSHIRLPGQTPISTPVLLFPWYVARLVRTDKHCWLSNILVMTEFHHTLKTFLQQWKNIQSPQNLCDIILHLYY